MVQPDNSTGGASQTGGGQQPVKVNTGKSPALNTGSVITVDSGAQFKLGQITETSNGIVYDILKVENGETGSAGTSFQYGDLLSLIDDLGAVVVGLDPDGVSHQIKLPDVDTRDIYNHEYDRFVASNYPEEVTNEKWHPYRLAMVRGLGMDETKTLEEKRAELEKFNQLLRYFAADALGLNSVLTEQTQQAVDKLEQDILTHCMLAGEMIPNDVLAQRVKEMYDSLPDTLTQKEYSALIRLLEHQLYAEYGAFGRDMSIYRNGLLKKLEKGKEKLKNTATLDDTNSDIQVNEP